MKPESLIKGMIKALGDDPSRDGLQDTPARVVRSWKELYAGYKMDPKKILSTRFKVGVYDEIVLCRDIEMYSTCEHHLLPFIGKAHVAYIPGSKVVGLSKLARLVECFSRRLQIQERLTTQISDALDKELNPMGTAVVIEAKHFCMCSRGVGKQNSSMVTSAMTGVFRHPETGARQELLSLLGL